jgi:RNA polymerase sigma-70 factor, ECF subfamily
VSAPEDDGAIIARIASGDRLALGRLYDRYGALVLAVGQRIIGDIREAEDLVHDVFLELWRSAGDYDAARGSVRAWILIRVRSRALDRRKAPRLMRQVAVAAEVLGALAGQTAPPPSPDRARVLEALAELPPEQRTALELGYFEGLSSSEIAERVAAPIGTVKSRVAAGLSKLRAGLGIAYREVE